MRAAGRGVRGAAGRCRRAAGAARPAGARDGDRGDAAVGGRYASGRAAELVAAQFDTLTAAAEGCDALVATGLTAAAGARSVAEKLGIRYVYASFQPLSLPSPHHPPQARPGRPFPPEVTDNRVLWDLDAQSSERAVRRGAQHRTGRRSACRRWTTSATTSSPTSRGWRRTRPWARGRSTADLDVVQTGAWILPDERPLPAELEAFLDAGTPPVYVGFGSMPMHASKDIARVAIEAIRAQGRRVLLARGWADLALIDDRDDCFVVGEVNQQALFGRVAAVVHHGGAGTTTTAARAGAPQVVVPQIADQPYWAGRVAELGIGTAHDGPTPTTESLSAALKTALTPETRARATAVAGTIRTDGATVAAKLLLDAISRERSPVSA